MIADIILLLAGSVVILMATFLANRNKNKKLSLPKVLSQSALIWGGFITVIKLLLLTYLVEHADPAFLVKIFVYFRPLLLGVLIKIVCIPFEKREKKRMTKFQQTPSPLLQPANFFPAEKKKLQYLLHADTQILRLPMNFIFL